MCPPDRLLPVLLQVLLVRLLHDVTSRVCLHNVFQSGSTPDDSLGIHHLCGLGRHPASRRCRAMGKFSLITASHMTHHGKIGRQHCLLICWTAVRTKWQTTVRTIAALMLLIEMVYWIFCFSTPMSIKHAALPDVPGSAAYVGTFDGWFAGLSNAAL